MVWVIWPAAKEVDVWVPDADVGSPNPIRLETIGNTGTLTGRDVIPGFVCPVAELFRGVRTDGASQGAP